METRAQILTATEDAHGEMRKNWAVLCCVRNGSSGRSPSLYHTDAWVLYTGVKAQSMGCTGRPSEAQPMRAEGQAAAARRLRALALLQRTWVWWLTNVCNSGFRGISCLF